MQAVVFLVLVSALLRGWAATRVPGPWFIPDEVVYAKLGQSLWQAGHFRILGATPDFFGLVYPLFVGLPLHGAGVVNGYHVLKWLQPLAMSLAAVPVYLWARTLVSEGWALAACGLTLCVPELGLSGFLLTEVLFYPVFCLAAWLMARALLSPTFVRQGLALAAILLAVLTRLQAIVLAPAFLLAGLLYFGPRDVRRLLPTGVALVAGAGAWVAIAFARGGHVLGAYHVTTGSGYHPLEALRFVAYHAADLALVTGVVPAVALIALALGRDRSPDVRAFVAITMSLTVFVVPVVGIYASRFSGRLEERNLIALAPLLFLALVVWLARPRTRLAALPGCVVVAALLLLTPWDRYLVPAVEPEAFSLVPLVEFREHLAPYAVVVLVGAGLIGLLLLLPRRLVAILPATIGLLLLAASASATHVATRQARGFQLGMVGPDHRWIDDHAAGPVLFLYGGELAWSAGGPVWTNAFWNRRVEQVDELFDSRVAGPIAPHRAQVRPDGRIVVPGDHRPALRFAVAPRRLQLVGQPVFGSPTELLWQVDAPLRIRTRVEGVDTSSIVTGPVRFFAYACRGGAAKLALTAPDDRVVALLRNGSPYRSLRLAAGTTWSGTVPLRTRRGQCELGIRGATGTRVDRLEAPG
jgi:hypothetical protein